METDKLLRHVVSINRKYEQMASVTGDRFNIFKILGVESNEVRMHSAFIAELLNPRGSHGQRGRFLSAFVEIFGVKQFNEADIANSKVTVEMPVDKVNEDCTTGGRIDIVVQASSGRSFIIENKIYAADQYNQLLRYKNAYPDGTLFYLTLDGSFPSVDSVGRLQVSDYTCISYASDIINWLEVCREKSVMIPMLRECISQYINLIKHLTHQSPNKIQEMEIQQLLLESKENFEAAENLANAILKIKAGVKECVNELFLVWDKKYGQRELPLFTHGAYNFIVKPSFEFKYFHFDLAPKLNGELNCANLEELKKFRVAARLFDGRSANFFWYNNNYTVWVKTKYDFENYGFDEYKKLSEDPTVWINLAMEEGQLFISHMIAELQKMNDQKIIINPNLVS